VEPAGMMCQPPRPERSRDHPTQRNRCRRFRPGGVERDHRHARDAYGGAQRQTSPSIREDDDRGAQPGHKRGDRVDH